MCYNGLCNFAITFIFSVCVTTISPAPSSYLICSSIVAGHLTLPIGVWTLLCVCVEDDAISWTGHNLLVISLGHEFCTENVSSVTWPNCCFDLMKNGKSGKIYLYTSPISLRSREVHKTWFCVVYYTDMFKKFALWTSSISI